MTHTVERLAAAPEHTGALRLGRALAAKAGDVLPLFDFASLALAGSVSLSLFAAWLAPAGISAGVWAGLHRLAWLAAAIAPFVLHEPGFAARACAGDRAAMARGFAGRFLGFAAVALAIAFAGRWLPLAPRGWLAAWLGSAALLTLTTRMLLAWGLRHLARSGALAETVAVVGAGPLADRLIPLLGESAVLYGVFDDAASEACAHPRNGDIKGLIARARSGKPDRILIALPAASESQLRVLIERLRPLGVPVALCPETIGLVLPVPLIGHVGDSLPVTLLADRPIKRWNAVLKAGADLVLASALALVLLPLFACIALAIRLDSRGPVFFKQRRHGLNNAEFDIYKFRTMHCATAGAAAPLKQTVRGDCRVTRVGRFLRKWSLDELPQVFNVLQGTMSLVGPRPHAVDMRTEAQLGHEIIDAYPHRHRVKPGITGWSQINGARGATDTVGQLRRRVELDLHYIDHWSALLDLKILSLTFREVVRATNAF